MENQAGFRFYASMTADEAYQRDQANNGGECPGCGRIMSVREAAEQGECNDCHPGGAWSPDGYYGFDEPRL